MIDSFRNAFRGILLLLKTERNFQIHTVAFVVVIITGISFDISSGEWAIVLIMSALVLGLEGMNSALEKLCDEVTMERKESIRNIKDIAAGAVLIAAILAVVVAGVVFYPHVEECFK